MAATEKTSERKPVGTTIALVLLGTIILAAFAILRPVPIVPLAECAKVDGVLAAVSEGGVNDVCLQIEGQPDKMFYINRGLEAGLDIAQLRSDLVGKQVQIAYPKYWTPLDPFNSTRHVSMLASSAEVLFDETIK